MRSRLPFLLCAIALFLLVLPAAPASADDRCDLVAAPHGSDRARGTVDAPLRSPQSLADRLEPGQIGCLRAGDYPRRHQYAVRFNHGGRVGAPLTLRSFPGERARLNGTVYVPRGSDRVRLRGLDLLDRTSEAIVGTGTVQVNARHAVLRGLRVTTFRTKTCIILGAGGAGIAVGTTIRDSLLFGCGRPGDLFHHAVYAAHTRGLRVVGNVIRGASGYGVHLYPASRGPQLRGNILSGNGGGVIIAGEGDAATSGARVTRNVIVGSKADYNVASYWGGRVGRDNLVTRNCLGGGAPGGLDPDSGFRARGNVRSSLRPLDLRADRGMVLGTACSRTVGPGVATTALRLQHAN